MSVYSRFKKDPVAGFRALIELLESTPPSKRQKMINVGMEEDSDYTAQALIYLMNFDDILRMNDVHLAELLATATTKAIAYSIKQTPEDVQKRFLRNAPRTKLAEIRDFLESSEVTNDIVGAAQLKMIEAARLLERTGKIDVKKIPVYKGPSSRGESA